MKQVIIDNPVINSPFEEPKLHHEFDADGNPTGKVKEGRRVSNYFVPIAQPRKRTRQGQLFEEETKNRVEENKEINQIRAKVRLWRGQGYPGGITSTTRQLLEYWHRPDRENPAYFCQMEAVETVIYLTEAAKKLGDNWIEDFLTKANQLANPLLFRIGIKMATGTGKTAVMARLIAWHVLNKLANPQDARFADSFLIVTPGITIRDRLRVLLPSDPHNEYLDRDIIPRAKLDDLGAAKIVITNFHAFNQRDQGEAGGLTKRILAQGRPSPFIETPDQMVRRVCREFGSKKNIIAMNDEAHHCYRRKAKEEEADGKLTGDDRKEAEQRNEEARVWISGLEAIQKKLGLRAVFDLSARPFFLGGSGYQEGTLFPWIVSDFALIDAIESGIVKVPRVPVADDAMVGDQPTYRDLWPRIRETLPRKGRGTEAMGEPILPVLLNSALISLYGNYKKHYARWEQNSEGQTPPVFIVVCNNTSVSKLVFDYIAGWEKTLPNGSTFLVPGQMPLFSNIDRDRWTARPNTILVDSTQLESGEGMSPELKKIAAREIAEFKAEYRARFPGRDADNLTEEDLLREVMNTVGKRGKLGENIKCVVSVSMLTEGWDASTVTHILGVRAFGTQLLCEQVVGRGLRRTNHTVNAKGHYDPEYAEVYGIPFSFIPCSGSTGEPPPFVTPTRVHALPDRLACEITFPKVIGYRFDLPEEKLSAQFGPESRMVLSTADIPVKTTNAPIVGETSIHTLENLKKRRPQELAFLLAKLVLEKYFRQDGTKRIDAGMDHHFEAEVQAWRFPELLAIAQKWLAECVHCKDDTFPQLLLLVEKAHNAADRIYRAISAAQQGAKTLKPLLVPYEAEGSTRYVDFFTRRAWYKSDPTKCHISHVVADTDSWEQKVAQVLEEMPEVLAYVKNQNLGFYIPYSNDGQERKYYPDFLARMKVPKIEPFTLILECSGRLKEDKQAKVDTAKSLWVPAVNNHGSFGRWAFLEITDPWDAKNAIRAFLAKREK